MKSRLMYVELKTGYSDDGPAWIGEAFFSKTGRSLFFNGLAFTKGSRSGGNYYEVLNVEYIGSPELRKMEPIGIGLAMEKLKLIKI